MYGSEKNYYIGFMIKIMHLHCDRAPDCNIKLCHESFEFVNFNCLAVLFS